MDISNSNRSSRKVEVFIAKSPLEYAILSCLSINLSGKLNNEVFVVTETEKRGKIVEDFYKRFNISTCQLELERLLENASSFLVLCGREKAKTMDVSKKLWRGVDESLKNSAKNLDNLAIATFICSCSASRVKMILQVSSENHLLIEVYNSETLEKLALPNLFSFLDVISFYKKLNLNMTSKNLTISFLGDIYSIAAAHHAARRKSPLFFLKNVSDLRGLLKLTHPRSVTIFGNPKRFDSRTIAEILECLSYAKHEGFLIRLPFGIMTAINFDLLTWLLLKTFLTQSGTSGLEAVFLPVIDKKMGESNNRSKIFIRENSTHDNLKRVSQNIAESVVLMAHGREDLAYLRLDGICTAPDDYEERVIKGSLQKEQIVYEFDKDEIAGLPCCVYGKCFRQNEFRMRAKEVKAKYVFINSCDVFKLAKGLYKENFSLTLNFVEGWCRAYVGSYKIKDAHPSECALFYNLLKTGVEIGESTRIVNNTCATMDFDIPSFLLLGDPLKTLYDDKTLEKPSSKYLLKSAYYTGPDEFELVFSDVNAYLIRVHLKDRDLYEKLNSKNLLAKLTSEKFTDYPLYYSLCLIPDEGALELYIYSWNRIEVPELRVKITSKPSITDDDIKHFCSSLKNAEFYNLLKIRKPGGEASNVYNSLISLSKDIPEQRFDLLRYHVCVQKKHKVRKHIEDYGKSMIKYLLSRSENGIFLFTDNYQESFISGDHKYSLYDCPSCREKLCRRTLMHSIFRDLKRRVVICARCGVVLDSPSEELNFLNPVIKGPSIFKLGEAIKQSIEFVNTTARNVTCFAGIRIMRISDALASYGIQVSPALVRFELGPGEKKESFFTIKYNENLLPHNYDLQGFVIADLNVYYASRQLIIRGR